MRNAEYSNEGRLALQLAETGAGVAAVVFSGATGMATLYAYAAYMAAKEAASSTGGTVGVLVGAASGAASAFGTPLGVGGSLSYSYEDGFTGNLSYGKAIGDFNLGGSLNFAQGQGITGYGLNTGMGMGQGPFDQLGLNLNYMADGSFVGGALSGSNAWGSQVKGAQGNYGFGLNFDAYGNTTGVSAKLDRKDHFGSYDMDSYHQAGVGLTMHMGGRTTLALSSEAGQEQNLNSGFYGWGAGVSGNFAFTPGGKLDGSSQSVDFTFKFQTEEQRDLRLQQYTEEMEHILDRIDDDGSRLISLTDIDELKRLHGLIQQEYDYTITGGSTPAWGSPPASRAAASRWEGRLRRMEQGKINRNQDRIDRKLNQFVDSEDTIGSAKNSPALNSALAAAASVNDIKAMCAASPCPDWEKQARLTEKQIMAGYYEPCAAHCNTWTDAWNFFQDRYYSTEWALRKRFTIDPTVRERTEVMMNGGSSFELIKYLEQRSIEPQPGAAHIGKPQSRLTALEALYIRDMVLHNVSQ